MIFEEEKIIDLIKANQKLPDFITVARKNNKELVALIDGKGFKELLLTIQHKEDNDKAEARRRYARSIKDLFVRLLRPIDNVYSATGGSKILPKNEKLLKKITQVRDGKTLEKWLQSNWMRLYHTDPNGVVFYEWNEETFYPTYKNINFIQNYKSNGQALEWILFSPEKKQDGQYWRFVDSAKDYLIKQNGQTFTFVEEKIFVNPFRLVPAVINSDIIEIGTELRKSPIDDIVEIAKEYLSDQSIKTIFKFLHGIPIFWRYAVKCNKCQGTGKVGNSTCPDCVNGYYVKKDITDAVTLPVPDDKEIQKLAPDIAGFIVPPLNIWDQYNKEEGLLYNIMYTTTWGVIDKSEVQKTATEIYMDNQPMITKLNVYADVAEWVEWYLTELAINFEIPTKEPDKNEAVVLYGRNYIIDSTETLLKRYQDSKGKGDNTAILDKEMKEWLLSKYMNDPETLKEELVRLQIEPFIHFTIEQVKDVYSPEQAKIKMLFSEWWNSVEKRKKTVEALKKDFDAYCDEKLSEDDEPAEEMEPELNAEGKPVMDENGKPKMKVKKPENPES